MTPAEIEAIRAGAERAFLYVGDPWVRETLSDIHALLAALEKSEADAAAMREVLQEAALIDVTVSLAKYQETAKSALASDAGEALLAERDAARALNAEAARAIRFYVRTGLSLYEENRMLALCEKLEAK